jgi:hypothetical protein
MLTALAVATPGAHAQPAPPAAAPPAAAPPAAAPPAAAPPVASALTPAAHPRGESAAESAPVAAVRIHDRRVFNVLVGRSGRTAEQRAAAAGQVLERSIEEAEPAEVRVEEQGDVTVVFAGAIPIIQLGAEDAVAAGDASLSVHAAAVAARTRDALKAERQRSAIANRVFSFSLVVFSGLIAFLLLRKLAELIERLRTWMADHPDRLPALHIRGIEVVRPAAVRGGVSVAITLANRLAEVGVVYGWVLFSLSLFEATRHYTERLTGFVLTPVSALMGRVVSGLPLLVIAAVTAFVVGGALRFTRLFFGSVARGETTLGWLPRDLATATGVLIRFGIVVVTLVVAAPLITGTDDGAISRVGAVALGALGLAAVPVLGTAATGIVVMFGRGLRVGEHAVVGGHAGRVRATTLLEVVLEDDEGCDVHVPHLVSLWYPTRILGPAPPLRVEITVAPSTALPVALETLERAASTVGVAPLIELVSLGAEGARLRVTVHPVALKGAKNRLFCAVSDALREAGIALGQSAS